MNVPQSGNRNAFIHRLKANSKLFFQGFIKLKLNFLSFPTTPLSLHRQSHDCLRSGPPDTDEVITVSMPNGQTLSASFIRQHTHNLYQVRNNAAQMRLCHFSVILPVVELSLCPLLLFIWNSDAAVASVNTSTIDGQGFSGRTHSCW